MPVELCRRSGIPIGLRRGALEKTNGPKSSEQRETEEGCRLAAGEALCALNEIAEVSFPERVRSGFDLISGFAHVCSGDRHVGVKVIGRLAHRAGEIVHIIRPDAFLLGDLDLQSVLSGRRKILRDLNGVRRMTFQSFSRGAGKIGCRILNVATRCLCLLGDVLDRLGRRSRGLLQGEQGSRAYLGD